MDSKILNADFKPYMHYNREVEWAVLGAILLEKEAFVKCYSLLTEDCFYFDDNKFLFRTLKWMFDRSKPIDMLTVAHFALSSGMEKWNKISVENFGFYLTKVVNGVCGSAHIEEHAKALRQLWAAREMTTVQVEAGNDTSLENALAIKERIEKIFDVTRQDDWLHIEEVITTRLIPRMDDAKSGKQVSFKTGFATIDNQCSIDGGDFIVLGARPSQGKTALAMTLAESMAASDAIVGIVSLETISERLAARLVSGKSSLEYWKIWKNKLTDEENQQFYSGVEDLMNISIYINDRPAVSAMDIRIQANKLKMQHKGKKMVIIIDYLQLITPETKNKSQRHQEIGEISRALRLLTLELKDTAVIALCQLNREADGEKPKMSHLRESGSIEQDADKIWLLHRDREKEETLRLNEGKMTDYDAELIIAKSKEGWTGTVDLYFSPENMTFRERSEVYQKAPENYTRLPYKDNDENPF